jgi:hypothetical protein
LGRIHFPKDNTATDFFSGENICDESFANKRIDKLMETLLKALPGAPIFPEAVFDGAPGALKF